MMTFLMFFSGKTKVAIVGCVKYSNVDTSSFVVRKTAHTSNGCSPESA